MAGNFTWTYESPAAKMRESKAWECMVIEFTIEKPTNRNKKHGDQKVPKTPQVCSKMDISFLLNR